MIGNIPHKISTMIGTYLCRNRNRYLSSKIFNQLKIIMSAANNVNFNSDTNGEKRVMQCLAQMNPKVVFDVGANVGEWAVLARKSFATSQIHAFEIVPTTYEKLKATCASDSNIVTNCIGLSDKAESIEIHVSSKDSLVSTANKIAGMEYHDSYYDGTITCQTATGAAYLEAHSIATVDFLKIDVEGMDMKVLKGFGERLKDVRVVQFEFGVFNISSRALLIDFFTVLRGYGFAIGKIYPNQVEFFSYHFSREDFAGNNYLAVRTTETGLMGLLSGAGKVS